MLASFNWPVDALGIGWCLAWHRFVRPGGSRRGPPAQLDQAPQCVARLTRLLSPAASRREIAAGKLLEAEFFGETPSDDRAERAEREAMRTSSRVFAAAMLTLIAGCGSGGASPDTGLDESTEVIRRFVVAFDNGDVEAAMALMADQVVSNDDGLLVGSDAIRSNLEATPGCPVRLGAVEPSGDDLLVTIEFLERDGETCPGHTAGSTGIWVFRVEGGKITKIP